MLSKNKVNLFKSLSSLNGDNLTHVLKHIDANGVESVCECVFNTIYTDLKLSNRNRNKIRNTFKNNKSLRNLKVITDKSKNIQKKRKALLQEGKGIGLILATVAPLLASLFSKAIS